MGTLRKKRETGSRELGWDKQTHADTVPRQVVVGRIFRKILVSTCVSRFTICHKTEVVKNTLNPVWQPFSIPVRALCNGDYERWDEWWCTIICCANSHTLIHRVWNSKPCSVSIYRSLISKWIGCIKFRHIDFLLSFYLLLIQRINTSPSLTACYCAGLLIDLPTSREPVLRAS